MQLVRGTKRVCNAWDGEHEAERERHHGHMKEWWGAACQTTISVAHATGST